MMRGLPRRVRRRRQCSQHKDQGARTVEISGLPPVRPEYVVSLTHIPSSAIFFAISLGSYAAIASSQSRGLQNSILLFSTPATRTSFSKDAYSLSLGGISILPCLSIMQSSASENIRRRKAFASSASEDALWIFKVRSSHPSGVYAEIHLSTRSLIS